MAPLQEHEAVLGIDPGNFDTAYVVLDGRGEIYDFGKLPNGEFIEKGIDRWVGGGTRLRVGHVACEMICSYGMPAGASLFETCVMIGQYRERCLTQAIISFTLVPRLEVKLSICKSPKANDSTIRAALIDQYGPPGTKKNPGKTYGISADVWAALALAETFRRGEYRPYVFSNDRPKKP